VATTERKTGAPRARGDFPEHYSQRNALVLEAAGAELVAGYREWQAIGRQVRRGEKGIPLEAPVVVKDRDTGEPKMVNVRTTYVFDVSQTDELEPKAAA